jgi:protein TonB
MQQSANIELKLNFRKYFDIALILAVFTHMVGFIFFPSYEPVPYVPPPDDEIVVVEELEEVQVPLPPVQVARPRIPIASEFAEVEISEEADPEETIEDTDVDIENPSAARLNYVEEGEGSAFTTYSDPPMEKRIYKPEYPQLARQAGIEGTVVARVYIDERGNVFKVEIIQSPSEIFIQPVKDALFKSQFYPAKQRDIAVKSQILVPFDFYLRGSG